MRRQRMQFPGHEIFCEFVERKKRELKGKERERERERESGLSSVDRAQIFPPT